MSGFECCTVPRPLTGRRPGHDVQCGSLDAGLLRATCWSYPWTFASEPKVRKHLEHSIPENLEPAGARSSLRACRSAKNRTDEGMLGKNKGGAEAQGCVIEGREERLQA